MTLQAENCHLSGSAQTSLHLSTPCQEFWPVPWWGNEHKLEPKRFWLNIRGISLLCRLQSTGMGFPERMWSLQPQRSSKDVCTWSWATQTVLWLRYWGIWGRHSQQAQPAHYRQFLCMAMLEHSWPYTVFPLIPHSFRLQWFIKAEVSIKLRGICVITSFWISLNKASYKPVQCQDTQMVPGKSGTTAILGLC